MSLNPGSLVPPDDSGTEALKRYRYQAEVAFNFCLDCALGGETLSVTCEHIEDIVVETKSSKWRFVQVKTRNLELGAWTLATVLRPGGGFDSLLRTFQFIQGHSSAELILLLEGAIKSTDDLKYFKVVGTKPSMVVEKVKKALKIKLALAESFCARIRVMGFPVLRETIGLHNQQLLRDQSPHLPDAAIKALYEQMIGKIDAAMRAEIGVQGWELFMKTLDPSKLGPTSKNKRLDKANLTFSELTSPPRRLLRRLVDLPEDAAISAMERKLLVGGADENLIQMAKQLRANASAVEYELRSSSIWSDDAPWEDLKTRLLARAVGIEGSMANGSNPAAAIWAKLMEVLHAQSDVIDSGGIFSGDSDLLLGAVCNLSDECKCGWGRANA